MNLIRCLMYFSTSCCLTIFHVSSCSFSLQRDVSNRGSSQQNNTAKNAGKRPRTRSSMGGERQQPTEQHQQSIDLADNDETMHEASKGRRSSLRLKSKRDKEEKVDRQAVHKRKKEQKSTRVKRRRSSSIKREPPSKKMKTAMEASVVSMRQIARVAKARIVTKIAGENQYLVHPDFRLQRESFNGKNYTSGIPTHDHDDVGNVLKNVPYASDLFQHLFAAEVSCFVVNLNRFGYCHLMNAVHSPTS